MNQTKLQSFIESFIQILIGYFISIITQILVFPLFDINISMVQNLEIGLFFMVISLIRMYLIRRFFNARLHNMTIKLTETLTKGK